MKSSASSHFDRLLHLGSQQDPRTGHYDDARLSLAFDVQLDQRLRQQHQRVFAEWLVMNLEQQYDELREYLAGCDQDARTLIQWWAQTHWYDRLVPAPVTAPARALFISDFEMILAVTYSDLQPENENPDLTRFPRLDTAISDGANHGLSRPSTAA